MSNQSDRIERPEEMSGPAARGQNDKMIISDAISHSCIALPESELR